ncbi:MAG: transporter substrate-binding domain-containing protein [bacterium]|nr:transporter substrate-binding domain-containing protein [bacterium]
MIKSLKIMSILVAMILFMCSPDYARTVKIIAEDDWYPYCARFAEGPKGIAVDIVRTSYKAEGIDVIFDVLNYDIGMEMVKDGDAIGCFDAPRTAEIEDVFLWHDERLFPVNGYFYANSDYQGQINSVKDAEGKRVGLTQGYGYGNLVEQDKKIIKEYSKADAILIHKLLSRRLDLIILFDKVADYLIPKLNVQGRIKQLGPSDSIDLYIAFSKKHPDGKKYRDIFSSGFGKIKRNGIYQKILNDWDAKLKRLSAKEKQIKQ